MSPPRQFAASSGSGPTSSPGVSLAMEPAEKYRRAACHSSCCSARTQPTSRTTAAVFGKMPTTSVRRLTSLFNRSIAWSQYTFSASGAAERDHVADLHVFAIDHDAVDEQLDESTSLCEVGVFDACANRRTEVFDAHSQAL